MGCPGQTLSQATEPDKIILDYIPDQCLVCQRELPFAFVNETRHVYDLTMLRFEVPEHHAMQAICSCGLVHTAELPVGVRASLQYGPRTQAAMVYFNLHHAVSVQLTAALMKDFFDLPVSQATVVKAAQTGADILQPTMQDIGQAVAAAAVAHADESGMRVAKKLHWLHVLATKALTWMGCHPKRGSEAFESLSLLQQFKGVSVHGGWMPYKALECQHALCNQHHLRELTYLQDELGQAWAGDMIDLLAHATPGQSQLRRWGKAQLRQPEASKRNARSACRVRSNSGAGTSRKFDCTVHWQTRQTQTKQGHQSDWPPTGLQR